MNVNLLSIRIQPTKNLCCDLFQNITFILLLIYLITEQMDREIGESALYKTIYNSQPIQILISVDKQITNNLTSGQIATRPSASNGVWCCALLPTVLVFYSIVHQVSELYTFLAYISVGLLSYCFLFTVFLSLSNLILKDHIFGGCAASSLVATLFIYASQGYGLVFSLIYSVIAVYSFSILLRAVLSTCPRTFTLGEAMLVVQSIVLFCVMAICVIFYDMGEETDSETKLVNAVIFTVLSSVGIIVTALCVLDERQKTLANLWYITSIAGTYALVILHLLLGIDCIVLLASYIFLDSRKLKLTSLWLCLVILSVFVVLGRTQLKIKASTVTRKIFHILASIVFLTGIVFDIHLITLAAGVGFGLMILVEAIRKSGIESISPAFQAAFEVYSDEKDVGCFAMTPIYLFVGLACPLILVPVHAGYDVELLSGVLSIGVGDTAASWFGSKYGNNKWADGQKSVEGTVFNILSQVGVMYALQFFDIMTTTSALIRVAVAAAISGLVEAKTDQVDNLVLPLVSIIAFQLTTVLSY